MCVCMYVCDLVFGEAVEGVKGERRAMELSYVASVLARLGLEEGG